MIFLLLKKKKKKKKKKERKKESISWGIARIKWKSVHEEILHYFAFLLSLEISFCPRFLIYKCYRRNHFNFTQDIIKYMFFTSEIIVSSHTSTFMVQNKWITNTQHFSFSEPQILTRMKNRHPNILRNIWNMLAKGFLTAVTHIQKPIIILVRFMDGIHKTGCR
jgi:hypothetical protein